MNHFKETKMDLDHKKTFMNKLSDIIDDNIIMIGNGSYANILYKDQNNFVTKKINLNENNPEPSTLINMSEIDILFNLKSNFLVKGIEYHSTSLIDIEKLSGSITDTNHKTYEKFSSLELTKKYKLIKNLFFHYFLGLKCLHDNDYLHLDINESNLMYSISSGFITGKIIDFGISVKTERLNNILVPVRCKFKRMPIFYTSYENIDTFNGDEFTYSDKSDIWSLGICLLCALKGEDVFGPDDNTFEIIKSFINEEILDNFIDNCIKNFKNKIDSDEFNSLKILLKGILNINPEERFNSLMIVSHNFFSDINKIPETDVKKFKRSYDFHKIIKPFIHSNFRNFEINSKYKYSSLKKVVQVCQTYFYDFNIVLLFGSVDLYMRVLLNLDTENGRESSKDFLDSLAYICVLIIFRLYFMIYELPEIFLKEKFSFWDLEYYVIKEVNFFITRDFIYEKFTYLEELINVFKKIKIPYKKTLYDDLVKNSKELQKNIFIDYYLYEDFSRLKYATDTKICSIKNFFEEMDK